MRLPYTEDLFFDLKDYTNTLVLEDNSILDTFQFIPKPDSGMVYIVELSKDGVPTDRVWTILGKDIKNYSNDIKFIEIADHVYEKAMKLKDVDKEFSKPLDNWYELPVKELKELLIESVKPDYAGQFPNYLYEAASKTSHKLSAGHTPETGSFIIAYKTDIKIDSYLIFVENFEVDTIETLLSYYCVKKDGDTMSCQDVEFDPTLFGIKETQFDENTPAKFVKITIGDKVYIYRDVDGQWKFFEDLTLVKAALSENKPSWFNVYDSIMKGEI